MKCVILSAILFVCFVQLTHSALFRGDVDECGYRKDGTVVPLDDTCGQCTCGGDPTGVDVCETCGVFSIGPPKGCRVEDPDASLPYPGCCKPIVVCPPKNAKRNCNIRKLIRNKQFKAARACRIRRLRRLYQLRQQRHTGYSYFK